MDHFLNTSAFSDVSNLMVVGKSCQAYASSHVSDNEEFNFSDDIDMPTPAHSASSEDMDDEEGELELVRPGGPSVSCSASNSSVVSSSSAAQCDFQIKGCWTPEEDEMLRKLVATYGPRKWSKIASCLPGRIGKQCRERFFNHLDNSVNHARFTAQEDLIVAKAHAKLGNQWATISNMLLDAGFVGRTSNAVKNHWNSTLARVIRDLYSRGVLPEVYTLEHFVYKCRRRRIPTTADERTGKRRRIVRGKDAVEVERVEVAIPAAKSTAVVPAPISAPRPVVTLSTPARQQNTFVPVSAPVPAPIRVDAVKMAVLYQPVHTPTAERLADSWTSFTGPQEAIDCGSTTVEAGSCSPFETHSFTFAMPDSCETHCEISGLAWHEHASSSVFGHSMQFESSYTDMLPPFLME